MKIMHTFPAYASGACDFVSRSTALGPDDSVVCLDVDVDNLPSGLLCLSSDTIKQIVTMLGWHLAGEAERSELNQLVRDHGAALAQLEAYDELLAALERAFTLMPVTSESPVADEHPSVTTKLEVVK